MNEGATGQGPKVYTKEEAIAEMEAKWNEVYQLGANTNELFDIRQAIDDFKKRKISQEKAMEITFGLEKIKQAYH